MSIPSTPVCPLAELPVGSVKVVEHDGERVAVFHREKGFFAVQDDCPHAYAPLSAGLVEGCEVMCGWHGWTFDLRNGAPKRAPGGAALKCYAVEVIDDEIRVRDP